MVLIQIRPDVSLGLIWVLAVFKCYQQTKKVITSSQRVTHFYDPEIIDDKK